MTLNDRFSGLLLVLLGLAVAGYARTFPPMPGQPIGPGLFPTLVGVGLAVLGAVLALSGRRQPANGHDRALVSFDEGFRRPRMALSFVAVVAALIGYALVVDALGFFLTGALFLGGLLTAFRVGPAWAILIAVVATVAIHYIFYGLLHVPLPWGVLQGLAW